MHLASVGPDDRRKPAHLLTPLSDPQAQSGRTGGVITPPWHTGSCHLEFRYRMINQANRRPGHASYPSAIRSKPFAPVFNCTKEQSANRPAIVPDCTSGRQRQFGMKSHIEVWGRIAGPLRHGHAKSRKKTRKEWNTSQVSGIMRKTETPRSGKG